MVKKKVQVKKSKIQSSSKNVPEGVRLISILSYIYSGLSALLAIFILIGSIWILSSNDSVSILQDLSSKLGSISSEITPSSIPIYLVIIFIIFVMAAIIAFFVGRNLWAGKSWARFIVILYSVIQIIGSLQLLISSSYQGVFTLIFYGFIAGYLIFNKDVKNFFK